MLSRCHWLDWILATFTLCLLWSWLIIGVHLIPSWCASEDWVIEHYVFFIYQPPPGRSNISFPLCNVSSYSYKRKKLTSFQQYYISSVMCREPWSCLDVRPILMYVTWVVRRVRIPMLRWGKVDNCLISMFLMTCSCWSICLCASVLARSTRLECMWSDVVCIWFVLTCLSHCALVSHIVTQASFSNVAACVMWTFCQ